MDSDNDPSRLTSFEEIQPPRQSALNQSSQDQSSTLSGFLQKVSNLLVGSSSAATSSSTADTLENNALNKISPRKEYESSVMAKYGYLGNQILISATSTQSSRPASPPEEDTKEPTSVVTNNQSAVLMKKNRRKNSLGMVVSGFQGDADRDLLRQLKVKAAELDDIDTDSLAAVSSSSKEVQQPQPAEPSRSSQNMQLSIPSLQAIVKKFGVGRGEDADLHVRKDHWMRDEISSECYQCRQAFTTFRRKHHCRICGHVFCNKCASVILPGVIVGTLVDIRVCDYCARIVYSYHDGGGVGAAGHEEYYPSELSIGSANSGQNSLSRSRSGSVQSSLATALQQQAASFNSLDNIRKFFNFPSKLWMTTTGSGSADATNTGNSNEKSTDKANTSTQLPFRTHESMDEQATPILKFNDAPESSALVDFFSSNNLTSNGSGSQQLAAVSKQDSVESNESENQLTLSETNNETSVPDSREVFRMRRETARTKYSAKVLRNKLSIAHSLDELASSTPLTPIIERDQARFSKDDSHLFETSSVSSVSSREGFIPVDLETMKFVNSLLKRLLKEQGLDSETWQSVIMHLSIQACQYLKPVIKSGDNLDIKAYAKIKKLVCAQPVNESQFVPGIVITKNVMHKAMLRIVEKPKILLLAFPLEYYRTDDQYMSLAPALSQEKEHLKNLVNRIAALNPDIVFVETYVSGVALDFLLAKNIIVVCNVKSEVMDTISRGTGAEIVASMDRITLNANAQLGLCDRFYVKTISGVKKGTHKTLMFLDGCLPEKFCTLILKGDDVTQLRKVKSICREMVSILYNLKMEAFVYRDMFTRQPVCKDRAHREECQEQLCFFKLPYTCENIASSPMLACEPPYLLDSMCKYQKSLKNELENQPDEINRKTDAIEASYLDVVHLLMSGENHLSEYTAPLNLDPIVRRGLAYVVEHALDDLNPLKCQNLMVLYSNVNVLTSLTCHHPNVYNVNFYHSTDMTLGQYLEELCFDSSYVCPAETCHKPMMMHLRSYAHHDARINVLIEEFPCPISGQEDTILTWGLCKICNYVSPVIPLSEFTWNYSFGKFLELIFYHSNLLSKNESCSHRLNRDHVRYFGLKNSAVRFEYEAIKLFELSMPALQVKHSQTVLDSLLKREGDELKLALIQYFQSLQERIDFMDIDETSVTKIEEIRKQLKSLSKRAIAEQATFLNKTGEAKDFRELNEVRVLLYELCCEWDYLVSDIIREYFVPEKTEKRNTLSSSLGMRKIFPERESVKKTLEEIADASMEPIDEESIPPTVNSTTGLENWIETAPLDRNVEFPQLEPHLELDESPRKRSGTTTSKDSDSRSITKAIEISTLDRANTLKVLDDGGSVKSPESRDNSPSKSTSKTIETATTSTEAEPIQRNSLIKTIKDFTRWTFSGSGSVPSIIGGDASLLFEFGGLKPLHYPFTPAEHFIKDSEIIVREEEPTSIVAFALSSKHYRDEISRMRGILTADAKESENSEADSADIESNEEYHRPPKPDSSFRNSTFIPSAEDRESIERILRTAAGTHIRYEFPADSTKCSCSVYFAEQFDAIRRFTGVEDSFIQSLSRCMNWTNKGGQSGSAFFKTQDDRFFMKQLSKPEMEAFLRFAPAYFEYISQAFFHDLPTVLAKLFGVYRIGYKSADTGKSRKIDVVVMENLFYNRKPLRIFDLKGSMRNRMVQSTGQQSEVLLDENLMQIIGENPLFIRDFSKKLLKACVWNDTLFLSKLNVMDYSMLVGIDETTQELVIGIVDFIRTFTWDKKLESWVKESGILGGGGREPTIISPKQYKTRFRESMDRYFLMVPDKFSDPSSTISANT